MTKQSLRLATVRDALLLWEWRNDPDVHESAFNGAPIVWESHQTWLAAKLASSASRIWILSREGQPVAQARYDRVGQLAEIGYSVSRSARGAGLGGCVLQATAPLACRALSVPRVVGLVKVGNRASVRSFEHAGFRRVGRTSRQGHACFEFEWVDQAGFRQAPKPTATVTEV